MQKVNFNLDQYEITASGKVLNNGEVVNLEIYIEDDEVPSDEDMEIIESIAAEKLIELSEEINL